MGIIDWREPKSLSDLSSAEALQVLGAITEALAHPQQTMDEAPRMAALGVSAEAQELADAARRFHRRGIAANDCRPALRQAADARRAQVVDKKPTLSVAEQAQAFADGARRFHRK